MFRVQDMVKARLVFADVHEQKDSADRYLIVDMAASYAGRVTAWNHVYGAKAMQKAAQTAATRFVNPDTKERYGIPQLRDHDITQVVGRVIGSTFVPVDYRQYFEGKELDAVTKFFGNEDMADLDTVHDAVGAIRRIQTACPAEYFGAGYAKFRAKVTDAKTIEKILSKEDLTLSTAQLAPELMCSICCQKFHPGDSLCEHQPGKVYDEGVMSFVWPMAYDYEEVSLTASPANGSALITSIVADGTTTEIQKQDSIELDSLAAGWFRAADSEAQLDPPPEPDWENMSSLQLYDEMIKDAEGLDPEVVADMKLFLAEEDTGTEDAKLPTEKRNKLKATSFCGPERSFPCNDCAHVTAARKLIGRYKGTGDKTKIAACIERKAKALGCDKEKDSALTPPPVEDSTKHAAVLQDVINALRDNEENWMDKANVLSDEDKAALKVIAKKLIGLIDEPATKQDWNAVVSEWTAKDGTWPEGVQDTLKTFFTAPVQKKLAKLVALNQEYIDTVDSLNTSNRELKDLVVKTAKRGGLLSDAEVQATGNDYELLVALIEQKEPNASGVPVPVHVPDRATVEVSAERLTSNLHAFAAAILLNKRIDAATLEKYRSLINTFQVKESK